MRPQVNLVTLGVPDLAAARRFYVDGLGWEPVVEVENEIVFIPLAPGLLLGLFGAEDLERDIGGGEPAAGPGAMTLAYNVNARGDVVKALEAARAAGATVLKEPRETDFGGFHAYFADPAGFRWEVCHNPGFTVNEDGTLTINHGQPGAPL